MRVIPAKWFKSVPEGRAIYWVVLHDMEIENKPNTAADIGHFFANIPDIQAKKASAHVGCDVNEAVRYVNDKDVAYAAPGANANGLHVELAGYAKYLAGDWGRSDMEKMLRVAAPIVRDWCVSHRIPMTFVRAADLKRGARGITTHYEVSQAFRLSDHTDPGPNFPISGFISAVAGPIPTSLQEASTMIGKQACAVRSSPTGLGYWVFSSDGAVFAYGDARYQGNVYDHNINLNAPIIDATVLPNGNGYWLLGLDGGVFGFGDAKFYGTPVNELKA